MGLGTIKCSWHLRFRGGVSERERERESKLDKSGREGEDAGAEGAFLEKGDLGEKVEDVWEKIWTLKQINTT